MANDGLAKIGFGQNWLGHNHDGQKWIGQNWIGSNWSNQDGQNGIPQMQYCEYTAVHAEIWSGVSIEFRRNKTPRNRGWLGTKNLREAVRGVMGIVQELQNLRESSSQQSSHLLAKLFVSHEDDHITEKPKSDNKTARKSMDPVCMNKVEQQLSVTSAHNPVV